MQGDVWIAEETFSLTKREIVFELFYYKRTNVDNQQVDLQHWSHGSIFLNARR